MVKYLILIFLLLTDVAFSNVYEIKIVKHNRVKELTEPKLIIYRVKPGDTLYGIVTRKFKLPPAMVNSIAKFNKLKNSNLIYAGQELKLPAGVAGTSQGTSKNGESLLPAARMLGGKVNRDGSIFLGNESINFEKNPTISINGGNYILDCNNNLNNEVRTELGSIGINAVNSTELKNLIEGTINSNFGIVAKNGKLVLGARDVLTYKYDYLSYDVSTGNRIVINLKRNTPPTLIKLLKAYGVEVLQPKGKDIQGNVGELKILSGNGIERIAGLMNILSKKNGVFKESGVEFPEMHIFVAFDFLAPEKKVELELNGYKVVVLSGNFIHDVENILSQIPIVYKQVKLVVVEPPGSNGNRSKFEISGLLVSTENKDWFLVDCVEKTEEIPYLRSRGVNLIIY